MEKVVYSKTNSYRKKEFRVYTKIVKADKKNYVEKAALTRAAISHIQSICDNYKRVKKLYKSIDVLAPDRIDEKTVRFPYVNGEKLDYRDNDIFDFNEEYICRFSLTKGFKQMFPGCLPSENETAVCPANLDGITGNFLKSQGKIYLFDYEWITDFPVPVGFLKFRTYYKEYQNDFRLRQKDYYEYMSEAGFDRDQCELYLQMENCLQSYINIGDNQEPIVSNYLKDIRGIDDAKENKIDEIEIQRQSALNDLLAAPFITGAIFRYKYKKYKSNPAVYPDSKTLLSSYDPARLDINISEIKSDSISKTKYSPKVSFCVDTENGIRANEIVLRGWVSRPWNDKAFFDNIQIVLCGEKCYRIDTKKELRNDLKLAFPYQEGIEGCGFVSFVSDKDIEPGKYNIELLCDDYYISTANSIELV